MTVQGPGGIMKAMDGLEPKLTEDDVNDLLDGDERDAGWDEDEFGWPSVYGSSRTLYPELGRPLIRTKGAPPSSARGSRRRCPRRSCPACPGR
ncbi:hypothetical protein PV396_25910 [Streptomyces sp. ME02-8801-2C]|uniref:hypothetical protein n=1 Tax=Streptomyces sp. ME02-8801-2C TaxID=3028680 RepID=UPI0029BF099C|nr:hypothetical protein [Streptomyces sp. ME02-8801-2C]MDX3455332.1 hypothetical protein [Streptomyces sp. ME02-8801-2C]